VLHLHDISRLNHCFDFGPTVNPSLRQGRQAHASAANTAITRVLYTAHRGPAHTAFRPSCSDLSRVQLPFHTLPPPISCRSRRTRTHVCKPSRPSRGPAASASACAFGCPRGRAKPASAATLRSIYATASTKMARVAGIEDFQVELRWSRSGRTSYNASCPAAILNILTGER
jgi:hypothetical protein